MIFLKDTGFVKCEINMFILFLYQIIRVLPELQKKLFVFFFYNASDCFHVTQIIFFFSFLSVLFMRRDQCLKYL